MSLYGWWDDEECEGDPIDPPCIAVYAPEKDLPGWKARFEKLGCNPTLVSTFQDLLDVDRDFELRDRRNRQASLNELLADWSWLGDAISRLGDPVIPMDSSVLEVDDGYSYFIWPEVYFVDGAMPYDDRMLLGPYIPYYGVCHSLVPVVYKFNSKAPKDDLLWFSTYVDEYGMGLDSPDHTLLEAISFSLSKTRASHCCGDESYFYKKLVG